MSLRDTIQDLTITLLPGGTVVGVITASNLKVQLEIVLLILSILYTLIRLVMLIKRHGREEDEEAGDKDDGPSDPPDGLDFV